MHDDKLPYQVWLQSFLWFRRYLLDKAQTHRKRERKPDRQPPSPTHTHLCYGGITSKAKHSDNSHSELVPKWNKNKRNTQGVQTGSFYTWHNKQTCSYLEDLAFVKVTSIHLFHMSTSKMSKYLICMCVLSSSRSAWDLHYIMHIDKLFCPSCWFHVE